MLFLFSRKNPPSSNNFSFIRIIGDYYFFAKSDKCNIIKLSEVNEVFILGDCLNPEILEGVKDFSSDYLKQLKGLFILICISNNSFQIYSSLFGILPVYFTLNYQTISNSIEFIKEVELLPTKINKQFILESFLFNFAFSDKTYIDTIKRLDAFSGLVYKKGEILVENYENILNWFSDKPLHGKKHSKETAELFLQQTKQYFSQDYNSVTFTGGFDGRTIVSVGLLYNKNFETVSWGIPENNDVMIPLSNVKELDLKYHYYNLLERQYIESYYDLSQKMTKITGGFNGFLYPHFLYGASNEKKLSNTLLVGYCGSELFRALHVQGAITSADLVRIFTETDDFTLKKQLWESDKLFFLDKNEFKDEFETLFEEIISFRKTIRNFYTKNHFFYYYIFSEVFRKIFGSLTVAQFSEISVRIPYLDYDFVIALLKTDLAGCNNDFFIHNPFKRLKGQQLYAEIIKQSNSILYKQYTGKGYRPCDLLSITGNIKIVAPYLRKIYQKTTTKSFLDNLGLISSYSHHRNKIENSFSKLENFNMDRLKFSSLNLNPYMPESERDMLFLSASFASLL